MAKYLGSHVSMKAPRYYVDSILESLHNGANTLMLYTGAPQNAKRIPLEELHIEEALELAKEHQLDSHHFIVHAPYIINLANPLETEKVEMGKRFLLTELERTEKMGISTLVLHPGSHKGAGEKAGLDTLISSLNDVLAIDPTHVIIALETMAGKGFEVGRTLDELAYVYQHIIKKDRIGFCLDTCHLSDGGYDLTNTQQFLALVDEKLGLENIKVVHLNDSKNPIGSHKDRHENIGFGQIGFDTLYRLYCAPELEDVPFILETPYVNEKSPYEKEISMLHLGVFDEEMKEKL